MRRLPLGRQSVRRRRRRHRRPPNVTHPRSYSVNVQSGRVLSDDLYQAFLPREPVGQWGRFDLQFGRFTLTGAGQPRMLQRPLNPASIESIGFGITDAVPGPFELRVAFVTALRTIRNPEILLRPQRDSPFERELLQQYESVYTEGAPAPLFDKALARARSQLTARGDSTQVK